MDELHGKFVTPRQPLGSAGPPFVYTPPPFPQRAGRLSSAIEGYTAAPTTQQNDELETLAKLLGEAAEKLKKLVDEDLARLNKMMNEAGIPHISVAPPAPPVGGRRASDALCFRSGRPCSGGFTPPREDGGLKPPLHQRNENKILVSAPIRVYARSGTSPRTSGPFGAVENKVLAPHRQIFVDVVPVSA